MNPIKLFAVSLIATFPTFAAAPAFAADAASNAKTDVKDPCEQTADLQGINEFTCPLKRSKTEARYRFRVTFTGVHDDTKVSMEPMLDEKPLTCAEGSKTDFIGDEVGKSSLECRFAVPASKSATPVLKVRMRWTHGDYAGVEIIHD